MNDENNVVGTWMFYWRENGASSTLILHQRTKEDALKIATDFGYTPRVWWKPSTWNNRIV